MTPSRIYRLADQAWVALVVKAMTVARMPSRHRFLLKAYRRWGMKMKEWPNYISSRSDVDGTDLSLISVGEGVTISSYVRLLTHDWAPHTIGKALGVTADKPLGRTRGITIGDFSFIGTASVVMPGTTIGRGCLIAAGTVARGTIPDYSLVVGSPGQIVGDTRDYFRHLASKEGWPEPDPDLLPGGAGGAHAGEAGAPRET